MAAADARRCGTLCGGASGCESCVCVGRGVLKRAARGHGTLEGPRAAAARARVHARDGGTRGTVARPGWAPGRATGPQAGSSRRAALSSTVRRINPNHQ